MWDTGVTSYSTMIVLFVDKSKRDVRAGGALESNPLSDTRLVAFLMLSFSSVRQKHANTGTGDGDAIEAFWHTYKNCWFLVVFFFRQKLVRQENGFVRGRDGGETCSSFFERCRCWCCRVLGRIEVSRQDGRGCRDVDPEMYG